MVPAHFHDVDGNLSDHNIGNSDSDLVTSCFTHIWISISLMVPAHFHDVTYDHIW